MMAAARAGGRGGRFAVGGSATVARLPPRAATTAVRTVSGLTRAGQNRAAAVPGRGKRRRSCAPAAENGAARRPPFGRGGGGSNFEISRRFPFAGRSAEASRRGRSLSSPPFDAAAPASRPNPRLLSQSLRHALLKPRSLPLPRYVSLQHVSFTFSELFGHSSFILVAASYATQDFLELRIMAVLGSGAMLFFTYFHPHGRVLWLPLKWNLLFVAINSYRIGKVFYDRYMADGLDEEFKGFREAYLSVIDVVDWYKLVRIATVEEFDEGDLVVHQGEANHFVRIVLEGELEVLRDGTLTYVVEKGNFICESGLHAGLMLKGPIESPGTVVVAPLFDPTGNNNTQSKRKNRVRCLRWNRSELTQLLESDKGLRNALQAALSWDIVRKLKTQRRLLAGGRAGDPIVWTRKREDQGIGRYAGLLQNMLRRPAEFQDMSEMLTKYRMVHHIDNEDHKRALARCGWTEEEFRLGRRRDVEDDEDMDEEEFKSGRWGGQLKRYSTKAIAMVWTTGETK